MSKNRPTHFCYYITFFMALALIAHPSLMKAQEDEINLFKLYEQTAGEINKDQLMQIAGLDSLIVPAYGCENVVLEYKFFYVPADTTKNSAALGISTNKIPAAVKELLISAASGDRLAFQDIKTTCNRNVDNGRFYDLSFICRFEE